MDDSTELSSVQLSSSEPTSVLKFNVYMYIHVNDVVTDCRRALSPLSGFVVLSHANPSSFTHCNYVFGNLQVHSIAS